VAGARIETINQELRHPAIVRVMPNTPAQIGEGMSVWTATPEVTEEQHAQAQAILQALGQEICVEDEDALDMATAVSGTGPTYVFLVMEALVEAAVHLGFSRRVARKLVIQTMLGSALFAGESGKHLAELRNMVTSPGGTSAEAIYQLEKGALRTIISKAVWAAYQKSRLLGEMSAKKGLRSTSPLESPGIPTEGLEERGGVAPAEWARSKAESRIEAKRVFWASSPAWFRYACGYSTGAGYPLRRG